MSNDFEMRLQLQKVVAYRELCRKVRHSGQENIVYAFILGGFAFFSWNPNGLYLIVICVLLASEFLVGLVKWFLPSAECFILDGIVFLLLGAYYLGIAYLLFRLIGKAPPALVLVGAYTVFGGFSRLNVYKIYRKLFAERPSAQHIAWFDELVHEIRTADPHTDNQALDLPTGPHWKAKLLGSTAFFVALRSTAVWVLGPEDFAIALDKPDYTSDKHKAILNVHNRVYPVFGISSATWENYQKWRDALKSEV
jgi:xanthosine utilization system XapX-like protein